MEEQIRALLLADFSVSAVAGARINFGVHPQGQPFPAIVLNVVSDADDYNLVGPTGLQIARVQVDCYAGAYIDAKRLSRSVRAFLSGYRGGIFHVVILASARDSREGGSDVADRPFRVSMDFMVHHSN